MLAMKEFRFPSRDPSVTTGFGDEFTGAGALVLGNVVLALAEPAVQREVFGCE
jgi:hypothetical protein